MEFFMLQLRVADWPALLAWYRDVLGLRVALEDAPHQFALFDAGPARVALKGGGPDGGGNEVARLVFRVADVEGERARLEAEGVEVEGPFANAEEGYREVRLRDPEGTAISLFAWETGDPMRKFEAAGSGFGLATTLSRRRTDRGR